MKNILKLIALVTLTAILCTSFASCSVVNKVFPKTEGISITFNKKYVNENNEKISYTFYADQTGSKEYYYVSEGYSSPELNYTLSGTVEFEWRVADDGCVYLFKTGERYNEDHTDGKTIHLTDAPFSFADEFMINVHSDGVDRYILEGSDLEKALKDK